MTKRSKELISINVNISCGDDRYTYMGSILAYMFAPAVGDSEKQEGRSFSFCPTASPPFKSYTNYFCLTTKTITITIKITITMKITITIKIV